MMRYVMIGLMLFLTAVPVFAETVMLDTGQVIEGRVTQVTDDYIQMITDGETIRVPFRRMDFDSAHYYRSYTVPIDPSGSGGDQNFTYQDFLDKGLDYASKGQFEDAVEQFSRAIHLRGKVADPYLFRAMAYQELGKLQEAIADYDRLVQIDPKNPEFYARRGWVYQTRGMTDQAIKDYSQALDLDPYDMEIVMERYRLNVADGNAFSALKDLKHILWLDPEAVDVYLDYAFLSYEMGNYYTAWQNVDKALRAGVDVPRDFIKALDEKMPNPFFRKRTDIRGVSKFIQDAKKIFNDYSGFLFSAAALIGFALIVLMLPSMKHKEGMTSKQEEDTDSLFRPVLFVKAAVVKRMCAALIDVIILSALSWGIVIFLRKDIFAAVLGLLYLVKDSFGGVSIGKGLIGLRVVDEHGYRSVFFQGFVRNFTLGLPIILFYVIFWTTAFRVNDTVRIVLLALWACFVFELFFMMLSKKDGQRLGDRLAGVFVHDLHADQWKWPYFFLSIILFFGFLAGTVAANMMFNKAFIYKLNPMRYYNIDHDFSFVMPSGWGVESEGEGGMSLSNDKNGGAVVFVMNEDAKNSPLELCVTAFTRSMEDAGLEKNLDQPIEISGLPAHRVGFFEKESGTAILFVYFKKDRWGPLYILQASAPLASMKQVMPQVMEIVKSFHFE